MNEEFEKYKLKCKAARQAAHDVKKGDAAEVGRVRDRVKSLREGIKDIPKTNNKQRSVLGGILKNADRILDRK